MIATLDVHSTRTNQPVTRTRKVVVQIVAETEILLEPTRDADVVDVVAVEVPTIATAVV